MSAPVTYRLSVTRPHSHLFEVQAHFPPAGDELTICFPVWTPGSYLVREYGRHVQELQVVDLLDHPVPFTRVDKRTLRIRAGNKPVRVNYKVYANELTVRTSHLDGSHGYFNGANLFYYCEALRGREHRVALHLPQGWSATSPLPMQGMELCAKDYDELVDSPCELGTQQPLEFTAAGVTHQVVLWGDPRLDEKRLLGDLTRVVQTEAAMFGGLPLQRYVFFIYASDKGRGGLEHKASTALLYPRTQFTSAKGWEDFLTLAAHEYFHLWNVKRIKPRALVPFDYSQEVYTTLLWAFEGGTSYYDNLLVRRAGLMSASRYLTRLGESFSALHATPGRKVMTLEDASYLSWVKHYRPDEHSPNSMVSYYLKGELVCCLLDLTLRQQSKDQKSLDDVLRLLWAKYGDESGVPEGGVETAASEVAGTDLKPFFDRALRSTDELDYSVFAHVGLELRTRVRESAGDKGGGPPRVKGEDRLRGWLGASTRGSATVASVLEGSPAQQGGLYPDDELVALDGLKVDGSSLAARVDEKRPGDRVKLTVFRRERLTELELTLGSKPADAVYFARVERPTDEQRAAYRAWLSASWDEPTDRPTL